MTRSEMKRIVAGENVKYGYCKFQEDGISRLELKEIGINRGIYGWNWTLYYHPETDTYYVDGYRNM